MLASGSLRPPSDLSDSDGLTILVREVGAQNIRLCRIWMVEAFQVRR